MATAIPWCGDMATKKTIRVQIYEALIAGVLSVLSDSSWGISAKNVVSEPNSAGQQEDLISFRILVYNQQMGMIPQTLRSASEYSDPYLSIQDVRSVVTVRAHGSKAWAWLDTWLQSLEDVSVIEYFKTLGFSVESDLTGIRDVSAIMGAREQTIGTASIAVSCRAIRERVITLAEQIEVTSNLSDTSETQTIIITETL
tara:strand:- start:2 stop:598 length:597 start_codon:yes stop_codon:yes gene_type:complete